MKRCSMRGTKSVQEKKSGSGKENFEWEQNPGREQRSSASDPAQEETETGRDPAVGLKTRNQK
jgi:hypothetical protein